MGVCSGTNFMAVVTVCDLTSAYLLPMVSLELVISLRSQGQAPGELSGGVLVFGDTEAGRMSELSPRNVLIRGEFYG